MFLLNPGHQAVHISLLPAEILSQILSFAKCDGIEITDPTTFPVNLYLVCKIWRGLVLSTPKIWSHIRVNLDQSSSSPAGLSLSTPSPTGSLPHNTILDALKTCIDRSKSQPLTLQILARQLVLSPSTPTDDFDNSGSRSRDLLASILVILLRYSSRWVEVEFDFDLDLLMLIIPLDKQYPLLEKLVLGCGPASDRRNASNINFESLLAPRDLVRGTFSRTPRLTRLEINNLPTHLHRFTLPWCQITRLKISLNENIFTYGLKFASQLPKLASLSLCQRSSGFDADENLHFPIDSLEPRTHECVFLEELSLSCWQGLSPSATLFFLRLRMPRLRVLHLLFRGDPCPLGEWFRVFKTLISHSDCTIRSLTLVEMKGACVLAIVRALESIEELTLERIRFTKGLLTRLTYPDFSFKTKSHKNKHPVGRQVSKLTIKSPLFIDSVAGPDQFIAMIYSRLPSHCTFPSEVQHTVAGGSCSLPTKQTRPGETLIFLRMVIESFRDVPPESSTGNLYARLSNVLLEHQWDDWGIKVILEEH